LKLQALDTTILCPQTITQKVELIGDEGLKGIEKLEKGGLKAGWERFEVGKLMRLGLDECLLRFKLLRVLGKLTF
jgi:hypothetical protein